MEKNKSGQTRRDFLKTAGIAGVAATVSTMLPGCTGTDTGTGTGTGTSTQPSFLTPPAPITNISKTVTADIIVVGAGTAGLVCALSAAQNGAKVVLISASKDNIGRGGSNNAVYSSVMQAAGIARPTDPSLFLRHQLSMAGYDVDQDKWWKFAKYSEEAMDWLIGIMTTAGYQTVLEMPHNEPGDPKDQPVGSHSWVGDGNSSAGGGQQLVVDALAKAATAAGVQIIYQTVAKQLVRGSNNTGQVTAVIALGADGTYTQYAGGKAIVLATGDFSTDKEMMTYYCPRMLPLLSTKGNQGYDTKITMGGIYPGDGQKMGLWIGAAWQRTVPNCPMFTGAPGPGTAGYYMGHSGLLVNQNGQRYSNEDNSSTYAGEAVLHQPGGKAYAIWGTNYATDAAPFYGSGQKYGDSPLTTDKVIASFDTTYKADTIAGVISNLGLPAAATLATVNRYNTLCANGQDTDFFKRKQYLVGITTGPFYGAVSSMGLLTVLGGLRTNINMQVCDANDNPIPGLYNVGTMVGDYYANTYNFLVCGNNLGANCVTFGYTTGRDIATGTVSTP